MISGLLSRSLRAFVRDERGTIVPVFALSILVMLGVAGLALDAERLRHVEASVQQAADAAVLAAAHDPNSTVEQATSVANAVFSARSQPIPATVTTTVDVSKLEGEIDVTMTVKAVTPLKVMQLFGLAGSEINITSKAGQSMGNNELYVAIDMSASLGLAADPAARAALMALTKPYMPAGSPDAGGCAFACHKRDGWEPGMKTVYDMARAANIPLREDVMAAAFGTLVDAFMPAGDPAAAMNSKRMSVIGFSDAASMLLPPANDAAQIKAAPATFNDALRLNTKYDNSLPQIRTMVGAQGTGKTGSPTKWMVLITDGLGWDRNGSAYFQGPIKPELCDSFKNDGITVVVIEVKYLDETGEYWFNQQVAPVYPNISTALDACASPGYHFQALDSDMLSLNTAFRAAGAAMSNALALKQ